MRRSATLAIIFGVSALLAFSSLADVARAEIPEPEETPASEDSLNPKFSMSAIDTDRGYVELDTEPGERHVINFDIRNTGNVAGVADVYAADLITRVNGGPGARGLDDPRTGATGWLNFTSDEFELEPDEQIIHTVTLDIPDDVAPGQHMTAVVIQNQEPTSVTADDSGVRLDQVSRHAIGIMINIPGPEEPGLEIGEAEHRMAGHNSTAWIEVENTGNVMVRPETGEFWLEDDDGFEMLRREVSMKAVYAGHETYFSINFGERLEPGDYWVWLHLADEDKDVSASGERLLLHVEEPPPPPEREDGGMAGLMQPPRMPGDDGSGSWLTLIGLIAAISFLAALIGVLLGRRRRGQAPEGAVAATPTVPGREAAANVNRAAQTTVVEARQSASRPAPGARRVKPLRPSG